MQISPSEVKLQKTKFEIKLLLNDWMKLLEKGDFYSFENQLTEEFNRLYDEFCKLIITKVSQHQKFIDCQKKLAKVIGFKKLKNREVSIQLKTGTRVKHNSLYAKKAPKGYKGSRHLSQLFWSIKLKSSPKYQSINCLLSVICPSFEVSKSVLNFLDIKANYERTRELSLSLGKACIEQRSTIQLAEGETLCGKRVIIAIDGGRVRTRWYAEQEKKPKRTDKFEGHWREPKLFIITTIDENGNINKQELPIYDCSFGDDKTFEILEQYLSNLNVGKAKNVQVLGDGAPWIWNRAKPMLMRLGVKEENITETLDYYHAMEHLNELKLYIEEKQKETIFKKLKNALWDGDIKKMEKLIKKGIPGVNIDEFNPYQYFFKNRERIGYQRLEKQKRPKGSGIIESGIRRIINLRFKSNSSFWNVENVEKLILMRAIVLSGRWEIMMKNVFNN